MKDPHAPPVRYSVVIPAFNEAPRIVGTVRTVVEYLEKKEGGFEVIVVDDGSSDGTADACCGLHPAVTVLSNPGNRGKGYSVRAGVLSSRGELALFSDADLSTPIEELDKFLPWFDRGFDVVIGSRALPGSDIRIHQPLYRELMGKVYNLFVQALVVRGITDTQCGFKCFTRRAADSVFPKQTIERWGFDPEILFLARKQGFRVKDVPVTWLNRADSRVNAVQASVQMFRELFRVRLNHLRGRYR